MKNPKDYYEILGVSEDADSQTIQQAYRSLLRTYHPDKNPGFSDEANAKSKLINEAYETLKDPVKRRRYDSERARVQRGASSSRASGSKSSYQRTEADGAQQSHYRNRANSGDSQDSRNRSGGARSQGSHSARDGAASNSSKNAGASSGDSQDSRNQPGEVQSPPSKRGFVSLRRRSSALWRSTKTTSIITVEILSIPLSLLVVGAAVLLTGLCMVVTIAVIPIAFALTGGAIIAVSQALRYRWIYSTIATVCGIAVSFFGMYMIVVIAPLPVIVTIVGAGMAWLGMIRGRKYGFTSATINIRPR